MKKIIHPYDIKAGHLYRTRRVPVYCKIDINDGRLSITGVEGPLSSGNCAGGCGQIDMRIDPSVIEPAKGWTMEKIKKFMAIWDKWHLNDMRSACEHQRTLGWTYDTHHGVWEIKPRKNFVIDEYDDGTANDGIPVYNEFKGHACPICGYSIGSAWLTEELPIDVIEWLANLPDTDRTPAWI